VLKLSEKYDCRLVPYLDDFLSSLAMCGRCCIDDTLLFDCWNISVLLCSAFVFDINA
jgi:hypothetical protein